MLHEVFTDHGERYYPGTGKTAALFGVSPVTIRTWVNEGIFGVVLMTSKGRARSKYYTPNNLWHAIDKLEFSPTHIDGFVARVQNDADLPNWYKNEVSALVSGK